jgi:hypothetical protein
MLPKLLRATEKTVWGHPEQEPWWSIHGTDNQRNVHEGVKRCMENDHLFFHILRRLPTQCTSIYRVVRDTHFITCLWCMEEWCTVQLLDCYLPQIRDEHKFVIKNVFTMRRNGYQRSKRSGGHFPILSNSSDRALYRGEAAGGLAMDPRMMSDPLTGPP